MTKIEAMGPSSIKRLNQMARAIAKQWFEPHDAVELAASRYGLISVWVNERVVLYRTKRNKYVVCWTDFRFVGDGGAGFDDQVELFGDDIYPPCI